MSRVLALQCHPDTPSGLIQRITVRADWSGSRALWLHYHVDAAPNELLIPEPAQPTRADGLWRGTCAEVFLRRRDAPGYAEFNFSPSTRWAAYRFDKYREGMANLDLASKPEIYLDVSDGHFGLKVQLVLPSPWANCPLTIGLSAVIEEKDETKSYWALAHPPGQPDFHHQDCFALELAPPAIS